MKKKLFALLLVACLLMAVLSGCSSAQEPASTTAETTPAAQESSAAAETPAPAEETPAPAEEAPAPAEEAPASAEEAPAAPEAPAEPAPAPEGPAPEGPGGPPPAEGPEGPEAPADGDSLAGIPGEGLHFLYAADPELYPLEGDTVFTVYSYFQNQSGLVNAYEEYPMWADLEAATGVRLEWNTVSPDAFSVQNALFLASGEYTDLFYKFSYDAGVSQAYEDEIIIALNDLIDEQMPNYAHAITWDDSIQGNITQMDGNIYTILPIIEYEAQSGGWTIRQDFLDQIGMDVPLTVDDLENVLVAFRDELGMNSALMINQETYSNAFVTTFDATTGYYWVDGQVRYGPSEEGYRDSVALMNKWYDMNLFDHDFLNITSNPRDPATGNLIASGDTGVFKTELRSWESYLAQAPESQYTALSVILRDENALNHFFDEKSHTGNGGTTISTACSDPVLAAQYLDYMFTKEGSVIVCYGVEGKSFNYDENGEPQFDGEFLYQFMEDNNVTSTNFAGAQYWYPMNDWLSFRLYIPAEKNWVESTPMELAAIAAWNDKTYFSEDNWGAITAGGMGASPIKLTSEETEEIQNLQSDLSTYIDENLAKFVIGAQSMDGYDDFVQTMYDSYSLGRILEIYQGAYERIN